MGEGGDDAVPIALAFEPHVIAHELDACGRQLFHGKSLPLPKSEES
jgi:hypothetical protein